jgi:hypothetical protein
MLLPNPTIFGALINLTQSCCSKWVGTPTLMALVYKYRTIPICWFSYHARCCLERWLLHPLSYQIPSIPCHSPRSIPSAPVPRQHGSKKPGRFGPRIRHILTWRKDVQRGNSKSIPCVWMGLFLKSIKWTAGVVNWILPGVSQWTAWPAPWNDNNNSFVMGFERWCSTKSDSKSQVGRFVNKLETFRPPNPQKLWVEGGK